MTRLMFSAYRVILRRNKSPRHQVLEILTPNQRDDIQARSYAHYFLALCVLDFRTRRARNPHSLLA